MAATKISFHSGNCQPAVLDFQVSALSQAILLEPEQGKKELIVASAVEILSQLHVSPSPHTSHLASSITSLQWTDNVLLAETIKISWNSWVKTVSSSGNEELERFWFQILAALHNSGCEPGAEIGGDIKRPSPGKTFAASAKSYLLCHSQVY